MIAKIDKPASGFSGIINYHEAKTEKEQALMIYNNTLAVTPKEINKVFEQTSNLNPRVKNKSYHISLNLPMNEKLTDTRFTDMALEYMQEMGFTNRPVVMYKHQDKDHNHIHIITSAVDFEGKKIDDSFLHIRSQQTSRELEEKYNLTQTKYHKFNNTPLNEINERKYHFQKAIKKGIHSFSNKKYFEKILTKEERQYIFTHNITNNAMERILGNDRYNEIGTVLEKNKLFTTLHKDELLTHLDYFHKISNTKDEFFSRLDKKGIYVRLLSDKGKSSYCYGIKELKFYIKDQSLPQKYRYTDINQNFKNNTDYTFLIPSEQKHVLYNRVNLAFHSSSNFTQFSEQLKKYGVSLNEKNDSSVPELQYSLTSINNPISIDGKDLSKKLSYYPVKNNFDNQKKILSDTQIQQIQIIENTQYAPLLNLYNQTHGGDKQDFEFDKMIGKKKKKRVGDRGRMEL